MSVDLDKLRRMKSTTPREKRRKCPECGSVSVRTLVHKPNSYRGHDADYQCENCKHRFDTPE